MLIYQMLTNHTNYQLTLTNFNEVLTPRNRMVIILWLSLSLTKCFYSSNLSDQNISMLENIWNNISLSTISIHDTVVYCTCAVDTLSGKQQLCLSQWVATGNNMVSQCSDPRGQHSSTGTVFSITCCKLYFFFLSLFINVLFTKGSLLAFVFSS